VVVERSIEDELEGRVFEILRARENSAACVCQNIGSEPSSFSSTGNLLSLRIHSK